MSFKIKLVKNIFKLCKYLICYSIILFTITIALLYFGILDHFLTKLIPYFILGNNLSIGSVQTDKLTDFKFNSVTLSNNNQIFFTVDEVNLHINWKDLIKKNKLSSNTILKNPKLYLKDLVISYPKAEINYEYSILNKHKALFNIVNFKNQYLAHGDLIKEKNRLTLNNVTLDLNSNKNIKLDLNILFNKDKSIQVSTTGSIKNFPIESYKILNKNLPIGTIGFADKIFSILDKMDINGNIKEGNWNINIDKLSTKSTVNLLDCQFALENTKIRYQNFPLIYDINSNVTVKGDTLLLNIVNAKSQNTVAKSGNIKVNLSEKNTSTENKVDIKAKIEGEISNLMNIFNKNLSLNINKSNIDNIQGTHDSNISIIVDCKGEKSYSIASKINNVSLTFLNGKIKFTEGNLLSNFDGNTFEVNGKGFLNKKEASVSYKNHLKPIKTKLQELKLSTFLDCELIKNNIFRINTCYVPLKINWSKDTSNNNPIDIVADLTKSNVILNKFEIIKPYNKLAIATIKTNWRDDAKVFLKIEGEDNLNVNGNISWNRHNDFYSYQFNKINYLENNLVLNGYRKNSDFKLFILAHYLDLSNSNFMELLGGKGKYTNSQVNLQAKDLKFKNNVLVSNAKYSDIKDSSICKQCDFYADLPNNQYIKVTLLPSEKSKKLYITTNNAGALFSGLNIYNRLQKGIMESTIYVDSSVDPVFSKIYGSIIIKNFVFNNMSFLTKLFSLASFPGIVSMLINNDNMPFSKLEGNFNFSNNILSISNTSAKSHFLDLTIEGDIDCNKRFINLSGKSIPSFYGVSYILHKLLSLWRMNAVIKVPFKIQENY